MINPAVATEGSVAQAAGSLARRPGRWGAGVGRPVDTEAALFSRKMREPSFYWGLLWPWLRSVLRGGIAYPWGLREGSRVQRFNGYSPSNLCRRAVSRRESPCGPMTNVPTPSRTTYGETVLLCLLESYSFSVFHITRAIAAIFLARETLARLGLVPAANQCR